MFCTCSFLEKAASREEKLWFERRVLTSFSTLLAPVDYVREKAARMIAKAISRVEKAASTQIADFSTLLASFSILLAYFVKKFN